MTTQELVTAYAEKQEAGKLEDAQLLLKEHANNRRFCALAKTVDKLNVDFPPIRLKEKK